MCGIIAYLGTNNGYQYIIDGLIQLQNRGYDSAGFCFTNDTYQIENYKFASTEMKTSIDMLREIRDVSFGIGIGHTRWATHGAKTDRNSHPHLSNDNQFAVVHNGIIENFKELKSYLEKQGYIFRSETDTEIIVNLISFYYDIYLDVKVAIEKTTRDMRGTWGIAVLCCRHPNILYATSHGSPLLIAYSDKDAMISSEVSGFCGKFKEYVVAKDNDIIELKLSCNEISFNTKQTYIPIEYKGQLTNLSPHPYVHWTLCEIHEQVDSVMNAMGNGGRVYNNKITLGGLEMYKDKLSDIEHIIFLGCGTSLFSANYVSYIYKEICNFNTIHCIDGAEFSKYDLPKYGKVACIFVSQSGETRDLHRCIDIINNSDNPNDIVKIGVINVVSSQIAREMDCGCYVNAGREVAVASTKSFTSQVIVLSLIALWFSQQQKVNMEKTKRYINEIQKIPKLIECILKDNHLLKDIDICADMLKTQNNCFVLGKGIGESVAKEGSLKLKEITYIHSEGYSTGSLKHGPFALIEEGFPIILLCLKDDYKDKSLNAYEEMKSRFANIIIITDDKTMTFSKQEKTIVLYIPEMEYSSPFKYLLSIIPLQLLAYKLSVKKGINPDMPRNLAKVVTVE